MVDRGERAGGLGGAWWVCTYLNLATNVARLTCCASRCCSLVVASRTTRATGRLPRSLHLQCALLRPHHHLPPPPLASSSTSTTTLHNISFFHYQVPLPIVTYPFTLNISAKKKKIRTPPTTQTTAHYISHHCYCWSPPPPYCPNPQQSFGATSTPIRPSITSTSFLFRLARPPPTCNFHHHLHHENERIPTLSTQHCRPLQSLPININSISYPLLSLPYVTIYR